MEINEIITPIQKREYAKRFEYIKIELTFIFLMENL